jgi:hypothetical protein
MLMTPFYEDNKKHIDHIDDLSRIQVQLDRYDHGIEKYENFLLISQWTASHFAILGV